MPLPGAHPADSPSRLKESGLTRKHVNQLVERIAQKVASAGPTPPWKLAEEIRFFFGEQAHHGACSVCGRVYKLTREELVPRHRPRRGGEYCEGGRRPPERYTDRQRNRERFKG